MGIILEGRRIRSNDDVTEDGKLRMNRGGPIDGGDHRRLNVEHVHDQLPAIPEYLVPRPGRIEGPLLTTGIVGHERVSGPRYNHRAILRIAADIVVTLA